MPDDRLTDILLAWEQSVMSGKPLSSSELCRGCPDLISELEREIERLQELDQFMFPRSFRSTIAASTTDPPPVDDPPHPVDDGLFPALPGYEFLEEIGRGGMGVVYKAVQLSLNRTVAIKMLAGSRWAQPGFVARLRQEANSLAQLDDPRIVKVFDVVETANSVSLVLEYVEGSNLFVRLSGKALPAKEAASIAREVARTLTVVHRRQLLHRDIKPGNVMIGIQGEIKVTDFGLAKDLTSPAGPTEMGDLVGTPSYMAPEQTTGEENAVDQRTDVYSVGATLYEMLTGRPPFVGTSTMDTISRVQKGNPKQVRLLNPAIPLDLQTICMKCLELDPNSRFDTAKELADELDRFLNGRAILSRPVSPFERFVRTCRRNPTVASLATLTTVITIAMSSMIVVNEAAQRRSLFKFNEQLTRMNAGLLQNAAHAARMQQIAEEHERLAYNSLYAADINRAVLAWRQEDTREMMQVLDRHIPKQGQPDRRSFIWWFLHRQSDVGRSVLLEAEQPQYILTFSPDGRSLVTAGVGAIVRFIEPESREIQKEFATGQLEINGVSFSPDQKELATSGDDGTIRIWNIETKTNRLTWKTPFRKVYQIQYLPDGNRIAACGNHSNVHIFDTRDGQSLATLEGHTNEVESLALGGDDKTLITIANDHTIRIWNLDDNTQIASLDAPGNVEAFLWVPKRGMLITGSGQGYLRSIDIAKQKELDSKKNLDRVGSIALSPDGSILAVGDASGKIQLKRLGANGKMVRGNFQPWQAHEGIVSGLVWSKDGSRLFSTGNDGDVISWNYVATQQVGPKRVRLSRSEEETTPDDLSFVLVDRIDEVNNRWDPQTGCPSFRTIDKRDHGVHISPDGKYAAAVKDGHTLELFEISDDCRKPLDEKRIGSWQSDSFLDQIQFSPDSNRLFVMSMTEASEQQPSTSQALVFRIPDLQLEERGHHRVEKTLAITHDGEHLGMVTSDSVILSDITGNAVRWKVSQPGARFLAFSPDGQLVAISMANRTVIIRSAKTGDLMFTLTNHRSLVRQMVFALDNRTLVASTESGSVVFTHAITGQELVEFRKIGDVQRLLFLENGRYLVCHVRRENLEVVDEVVIFDSGVQSTSD